MFYIKPARSRLLSRNSRPRALKVSYNNFHMEVFTNVRLRMSTSSLRTSQVPTAHQIISVHCWSSVAAIQKVIWKRKTSAGQWNCLWETWQIFSQMGSPPESGDNRINPVGAGIWKRVIYKDLMKTKHCYPQRFIGSSARAGVLCVIYCVAEY